MAPESGRLSAQVSFPFGRAKPKEAYCCTPYLSFAGVSGSNGSLIEVRNPAAWRYRARASHAVDVRGSYSATTNRARLGMAPEYVSRCDHRLVDEEPGVVGGGGSVDG